ncbi:hypothetical protein ACFO5K_12695 [Nocardia halotolerans]|uniref:Uncharacterized protein n=1 Tax=Nocardia halotolerans TaxID=1755878 RepID=A0ABV8VHJ8_9NOCA
MSGTTVVIDIEGDSKRAHRQVEIYNGRCAQFDIRTQVANTVTVTPN